MYSGLSRSSSTESANISVGAMTQLKSTERPKTRLLRKTLPSSS